MANYKGNRTTAIKSFLKANFTNYTVNRDRFFNNVTYVIKFEEGNKKEIYQKLFDAGFMDVNVFVKKDTSIPKIKAKVLAEQLKNEYGMECSCFAYGQDVYFYGSELDCFKMAFKHKAKESDVAYSENLKTWYVEFPKWFDLPFSQNII